MGQDRALPWRSGAYRSGDQVMFQGTLYYLSTEVINSVNLPFELEQGFWVEVGGGGGGGDAGWSPILAVVVDGERRVLRLQGWTGGTGTPPAIPINNYIGPTGFTDLAGAIDIRGATGATGADGDNGWSPVFAVASDGERRVLELVAYVGGEGTPPAIPAPNNYVGPSGLTNLAGAIDVRGSVGAAGNDGWSPILANEVDAERRVLRLVNWTGGTGTPPVVPADNYIGPLGLTTLAGATDIRGGPGSTVASGVSYTPTSPLTGVNVQSALDQVAARLLARMHPGTLSIGDYFANYLVADAPTTQLLTPNVLRASPFVIPFGVSIDELRFNVTGAGTAGSRAWVALYANAFATSTGDYPGALLATTGEQLADAATVKIAAITPLALAAGIYWVVYNCNDLATEPTVRATPTGSLFFLSITNSLGTNTQAAGISIASTYSATAPATFPAGATRFTATNHPILAMRRSA